MIATIRAWANRSLVHLTIAGALTLVLGIGLAPIWVPLILFLGVGGMIWGDE